MRSRDYQTEHIEKIVEAVSTRRKVLAQLPTGGGKTVEFSLIAQRYIRNAEKSVLILVHREELMYQSAKTIKELTGIEPYLITSTTNKFRIARVYIGMVESTMSRLHMMTNVGLVIIDECHIANFNKVHSVFLEELIIGFSATPISSSKKEPLNKYYSCICAGPQIKDLIKLGFLAQNITRCPKDIVDATQFEIDKLKGDYNERQMATEFKLPKHVMNVVKSYNKLCNGEKTIIFNVNIEHSKEVAECFAFCGYNVRHLDSNSQDRAEILKWFKETEDAILCNVMIATVGFDEPTIRNVILNFSTLSLTKFIQCAGRGGRIIDEHFIAKHHNDYPFELKLKEKFNIIDMGGNCVKFGDWNDEREWDYIFDNPARANEGVAPVKNCPECDGLVHAGAMVCALEKADGEICFYEFKKKPVAEEQDLDEMILITKGVNIDMLIEKNQKKYEYYTFLELAVDVIKEMYLEHRRPNKHIQDKYFDIYYKLCILWYKRTLAGKDGNIQDITNSAWHIKRALHNFNSLVKKYQDYPITTA